MSREENLQAKLGGSNDAYDMSPLSSRLSNLPTDNRQNCAKAASIESQDKQTQVVNDHPYPPTSSTPNNNSNDSTTIDVFAVAVPADVLVTPPLQPAAGSDSRAMEENFRRAVEEVVRQEMIRNRAAAEIPVVVVQPQDIPMSPTPFIANRKKYCIPCVILSLVTITAIIIALVVALTMAGGGKGENEITRDPTSTTSTEQAPRASYQAIPNGAILRNAIDEYLSKDGDRKAAVLRTYGNPIGSWNVSLVTDFSKAFSTQRNNLTVLFNDDISQWDTSSATDMSSMFYGASSFSSDLSKWTTSRVTDMHDMFHGASSFNADLSKWITSQVTNMYWMFFDASSFNSDLSKWNTSKVTLMYGMFLRAVKFDADLSQWDTSKVTNMASMFNGASSFNADLSQWDTGRVTNTASMFSEASNFNADLDGWDLSSITSYMWNMFYGASKFSSCLCSWRFKLQGKRIDVHGMFSGTSCPYKSDPNLSSLQTTFCCACGGT